MASFGKGNNRRRWRKPKTFENWKKAPTKEPRPRTNVNSRFLQKSATKFPQVAGEPVASQQIFLKWLLRRALQNESVQPKPICPDSGTVLPTGLEAYYFQIARRIDRKRTGQIGKALPVAG